MCLQVEEGRLWLLKAMDCANAKKPHLAVGAVEVLYSDVLLIHQVSSSLGSDTLLMKSDKGQARNSDSEVSRWPWLLAGCTAISPSCGTLRACCCMRGISRCVLMLWCLVSQCTTRVRAVFTIWNWDMQALVCATLGVCAQDSDFEEPYEEDKIGGFGERNPLQVTCKSLLLRPAALACCFSSSPVRLPNKSALWCCRSCVRCR